MIGNDYSATVMTAWWTWARMALRFQPMAFHRDRPADAKYTECYADFTSQML